MRRELNPLRLLTVLALVTLAGVIGLLATRVLWIIVPALMVISISCAGLYPLAQAQAYARRPSSSGSVRAIISLGNPFDALLPGLIGLIAAHFGILAALAVLGVSPLLVLLLLPYRAAR